MLLWQQCWTMLSIPQGTDSLLQCLGALRDRVHSPSLCLPHPSASPGTSWGVSLQSPEFFLPFSLHLTRAGFLRVGCVSWEWGQDGPRGHLSSWMLIRFNLLCSSSTKLWGCAVFATAHRTCPRGLQQFSDVLSVLNYFLNYFVGSP